MWASIGFRTQEQRAVHEALHKQRFRCTDSDCDFAVSAFNTRASLRKHILKYHTEAEENKEDV